MVAALLAGPDASSRLHDVVPELLDDSVRTRGRIWLAGRPDDVFWLESAGGGLRMELAGTWLAADGETGWARADPHRRAFASLRWHPRFGDRAQEIAVLVHRGRGPDLAARLRGALLPGPELALGPEAWQRLPDPFGTFHADPCKSVHDPAGTSAPHALLRGPG